MRDFENFAQNVSSSQQQGYQPQQGQQYNPSNYRRPRNGGPGAGDGFRRSPLAKIGLVFVILAVIGLIISYTVPWAMVDWKDCSLKDDQKSFGHDFKNEDKNHFVELPIIYGAAGGPSDESKDYFEGIPSMADYGFIFLLILGIVAIVLGVILGNRERYRKPLSISQMVIGATALIPVLWVLTSGIKLFGQNINIALNNEITKELGIKDLSIWFPAGYIVAIFGIIFLILTWIIIKNSLSEKNVTENNFPGVYFFDKIWGDE